MSVPSQAAAARLLADSTAQLLWTNPSGSLQASTGACQTQGCAAVLCVWCSALAACLHSALQVWPCADASSSRPSPPLAQAGAKPNTELRAYAKEKFAGQAQRCEGERL